MKTLVHFAVAAVALGVAVPALAGPSTRTTTVAYDDIDLKAATASDTLDDRVRNAARRVCGTPESYTAREIATVNGCRRVAYEDAKPAMEKVLQKGRTGNVEILVAAASR